MRLKQEHFAIIICARQREGERETKYLEANEGYAAMCKTNYIFSVFFLLTITFYSYYIVSILYQTSTYHIPTLRSQLKPEQLSTSKLSPPIPLFRNVSVFGLLLLFFLLVDLLL